MLFFYSKIFTLYMYVTSCFLKKDAKISRFSAIHVFFMIYFNMQSTSLKTTDSWGSRITNQAQAATKSLLDAREIRLQTP